MSVTFYKTQSKHEPIEDEVVSDNLSLLAEMVHEEAEIEWDRFQVVNDVDLGLDLRFVCLAGVWRAFHAAEGTFIAQWWPSDKPGESRWSTKRTKAMSIADIKRALEKGEKTEDLIAVLASGKHQDMVARVEKQKAEYASGEAQRAARKLVFDEEIRRQREGLCVRCGSEEGMLCECEVP